MKILGNFLLSLCCTLIVEHSFLRAGTCNSRPQQNENNNTIQKIIAKINTHSTLLENNAKGYQKLIETTNAHATQLVKLTNAAKQQFVTSNNHREENKNLAQSNKDIYTKISILQAQINSLQMQINSLKGFIGPQQRWAKLDKLYKNSNSPKNISKNK